MTHPANNPPHFDKDQHPALFQRISPANPRNGETSPARPIQETNIYSAFAQSVQVRPSQIPHQHDLPHRGSGRVWDVLQTAGFDAHEILRQHMGLYTTPEDIHTVLRSAGFSEAAIRESGLVSDEHGRLRHDWQGGLIVPLSDENGMVVDALAVIPARSLDEETRLEYARGTRATGLCAYCLHTAFATSAGRTNLVLVESILEAMFLQCRGFTNVAAVGGDGREFSPRRWEELARLGVETVTLAFGNDATRQRDVREALDHALRARTAPEVFILERTQLLENETLADVARRHGLEACQKAASIKSLAFHAKNFGWSRANQPAPVREDSTPAIRRRDDDFFQLAKASEEISNPHDRALFQQTLAEVNDALCQRLYAHARFVLDSRLGPYWAEQRFPEPSVCGVDHVLDQMTQHSHNSQVPERLSTYEGSEFTPGTVTVLANSSERGRLAELCSRLVMALENISEGTWLVVCREFSEEVIVLGLIAHMTRRMTHSQGLTFEEIRSRLSGHDPVAGYGDKPWLVDEAVDRLRRWRHRLQFAAKTNESSRIVPAIERACENGALGGVFFDHAPAASSDLQELASRFSCSVIAVTDQIAAGLQSVSASRPAWETPEVSPAVREFSGRIARWIERLEREEVRVA